MEFIKPFQESLTTPEEIRRAAFEKLYEYEQEHFFIDKGGAAKVYQLPAGYCLKVIEDRHNSPNRDKFDLGNTPVVEARLQEQMSGTQYGGKTRVPRMFGAFSAQRFGEANGIIMERLHAVNLQHIIKGMVKPPETFSVDDYFSDLENFVSHMHGTENIVHLDLFARNLMVDMETGDPRMIDFGRASRLTNTMTEAQRIKLEDTDWETLDKAYQDVDKIF